MYVCLLWAHSLGAVAATKLAMSSLAKPFNTYDFQQELGALAHTYLRLHGPESEELFV